LDVHLLPCQIAPVAEESRGDRRAIERKQAVSGSPIDRSFTQAGSFTAEERVYGRRNNSRRKHIDLRSGCGRQARFIKSQEARLRRSRYAVTNMAMKSSTDVFSI